MNAKEDTLFKMNVGDKQKCEHYSGEQSKDWRIRASEFLVSDGSRTNTHDSIDLDMGSYCLNPLCQGKPTSPYYGSMTF